MPSILINGSESDQVSVLDRGFQYGDGLFETIRVADGSPQYWHEHISRLIAGCDRLNIFRPDTSLLQNEAKVLCKSKKEGVLKIIITRGAGGRGYAVTGEINATRMLAMFPLPDYPLDYWQTGVSVRLCRTILGVNPALAGIKHLNRLEQVLARSEWNDPDIHEGLMMDMENNIIEGTMSNIFCAVDDELLTPSLARCGINGIIREQIIKIAQQEDIVVKETEITFDQICQAKEVFLTNSVIGIWPVCKLENYEFEIGPITHRMNDILKKNEAWG